MNAQLFSIGIFPWLAIAATLLFLSPGWPRLGGLVRFGALPQPDPRLHSEADSLGPTQWVMVAFLAGYLAVQLLAPFRHHLYPGEVSWNEQGHKFSWHMKLRDKSGTARFFATDPTTGETWQVNVRDYVTTWQRNEMKTRPDMIQQLAQHIAADQRAKGRKQVEVRAVSMVSLNGRPHQLLVNPAVDLAAEPRTLLPVPWVMPLIERR